MSTDHLFDPEPYGEGTKPRRRRPPSTELTDGPIWKAISSRRGVDAHAHIIKAPLGLEGSVVTLCELKGRAIPLDGVTMRACTICARIRVGVQHWQHGTAEKA